MIVIIIISVIIGIIILNQFSKKWEKEDKEKKQKEIQDAKVKIENEINSVLNGPITYRKNYRNSVIDAPYIVASETSRIIYLRVHSNEDFLKKSFSYDELLEIELITRSQESINSSQTITTDTKDMVKRAVIGDAIGGVAGAVIGAVTAKKTIENNDNTRTYYWQEIKLTTNNLQSPIICFHIYDKERIGELYSFIKQIIDNNKQKSFRIQEE